MDVLVDFRPQKLFKFKFKNVTLPNRERVWPSFAYKKAKTTLGTYFGSLLGPKKTAPIAAENAAKQSTAFKF